MNWDAEADVVVLGLGAAGCSAAICARDAGASVIVLEKMPAGLEGGNTRVSGGTWFANLDPELATTYLRALSSDYPIDEDVVRVWAHETARTTAWIESLGLNAAVIPNTPPDYPELAGSSAYGGFTAVDGVLGDGRLFRGLEDAVRQRGIDVRLATPARQLIQDEPGGAVTGVLADTDGVPLRVRARRGVILATGGFEGNSQMVRDNLRIPGEPAMWGSPALTGDGIRMAQKAGADLWHMANVLTICGLKVPDYRAGFAVMFPFAPGFIFVGDDGRRLINELPQIGHGHARLHGGYELFPARRMHVIFDERTRLAGPISPGRDMLAMGWNLMVEGYEWSADNSREIERGWIQRGNSAAELAAAMGLDPEALEAAIRRFNQACASGSDDQFGRDPATLTPLAPPYYGFVSGPLIGWTSGGPRRNHHAQVLDPFGEVIPGLYAAGDVSSTYSWCKAGGMAIGDALAFGRIAGRRAAGEPARG